jgi:hypothetical protein
MGYVYALFLGNVVTSSILPALSRQVAELSTDLSPNLVNVCREHSRLRFDTNDGGK